MKQRECPACGNFLKLDIKYIYARDKDKLDCHCRVCGYEWRERANNEHHVEHISIESKIGGIHVRPWIDDEVNGEHAKD